jgi:aminocarboxymuconate-semialdehyde decarboxylase
MAARTVDMHAHQVAPALLESVRQSGESHGIRAGRNDDGRWVVGLGAAAPRVVPPPLVGDDAYWDRAAAQGLDARILSGWNELFGYELDATDGGWWCRIQNDSIAALVAERGAGVAGLATVPLQDPRAADDELRRAATLGLCGAIIGTQVRQANLDADGLDPFWEAACELGLPLVVHPGSASLGGDRMKAYFLANTVGNPAETTLAAAALVFGGVLERFPELRIVLVHGGGFLPYQLGRLQKAFHVRPEIERTPGREPRDAARRFYYDTILHDAEALDFLIRLAGSDRLLFGTDFPFEMAEARTPAEWLATPLLDESGRDAVAGGNAVALFALA